MDKNARLGGEVGLETVVINVELNWRLNDLHVTFLQTDIRVVKMYT